MAYQSAVPKTVQKKLVDAYVRALSVVGVLGEVRMGEDKHFAAAAMAAFTKAVEFGMLATVHRGDEGHPFFLTATLRGICEDTIVLTWIKQCAPTDRSQLVILFALERFKASLAAQGEFFLNGPPRQQVLYSNSYADEGRLLERSLPKLQAQYGWPKTRSGLPSVAWCAGKTDLKPLYDYLYMATSQAVHFSPLHLFRSGKGSSRRPGTPYWFSTANNRRYYEDFNLVYAAHLVVLMYRNLWDVVDADGYAANAIARLEKCILTLKRWPEIITFDDVEWPRPRGKRQKPTRRSRTVQQSVFAAE